MERSRGAWLPTGDASTLKRGLVRGTPGFPLLCLVVVACGSVLADSKPTLENVLRTAATFVNDYESSLTRILADEYYVQKETGPAGTQARVLRSDVMVVELPNGGWTGFREVHQVGGHEIPDQSRRLESLFLQPVSNTLDQAARIADESARFNLGCLQRTINTPTFALTLLRSDVQSHSHFTLQEVRTDHGRSIATVAFQENDGTGMLVRTRDQAAMHGRFWIDADSGDVRKTELILDSEGVLAKITVTYALQDRIGKWLPVTMEERYEPHARSDGTWLTCTGTVTSRQVILSPSLRPPLIEGRADYSGFRVATATARIK